MNTEQKRLKEYFEHLKTLNESELNNFLLGFQRLTNYKERKNYLKFCYSKEIIDIMQKEEFLKLYYVDRQGNYLFDNLNFDKTEFDKKLFGTLVYCYNSNSYDFETEQNKKDFERRMESEGFKKISREQKEYDGKNVICFLDVDFIGLFGSSEKKTEIIGKLIYSEYRKSLMIIPKRARTRGLIIKDFAYIKEVEK